MTELYRRNPETVAAADALAAVLAAVQVALAGPAGPCVEAAGAPGLAILAAVSDTAAPLKRIGLRLARFERQVAGMADAGARFGADRRPLRLVVPIAQAAAALAPIGGHVHTTLNDAAAECARIAGPDFQPGEDRPLLGGWGALAKLAHGAVMAIQDGPALDKLAEAGAFGQALLPKLAALCDVVAGFSLALMHFESAMNVVLAGQAECEPDWPQFAGTIGKAIGVLRELLDGLGQALQHLILLAARDAGAREAAFDALARGTARVTGDGPDTALVIVALSNGMNCNG